MDNFNLEFHEIAEIFPLMFGEEFEKLKEDIDTNGLLESIVLYEGKILDGRNRYNACKEVDAGLLVDEYDGDEPFAYVLSKNLFRRHLTPYQKVEVGEKIELIYAGEAKEHERAGGGDKKSEAYKSGYMNSYNPIDPIDALEKTAKDVNLGRQTYSRGKEIGKALKESVERGKITEKEAEKEKDSLRKNEKSINSVYIDLKKAERREKMAKGGTPDLPEGKYNIIYADPPWTYRNTGVQGAVDEQYPTLTIQKLCDLPIKDLVTENAVLFLWVTNPILEECFPVIKSWGFEYKTNFVWIKRNKKTGIGYYVRGVHELLLICIKGSMLPIYTPLSLIEEDAREHSRKPEIYDVIEKMYPNQKYIELFARNKKEGWISWGNEILEN